MYSNYHIFFKHEDYWIIPKNTIWDNFDIIKITVEASDKSELKRTAEVEYEINGEIQKAYLRLTSQTSTYEGNIQILKSQRNSYKINSITLEDYLGNRGTYNL